MPQDEQVLTMPATDGRTIAELKADDSYQGFTVKGVQEADDGFVTILTTDGTGFGIDAAEIAGWKERTGKTPQENMSGRLYPRSLGSQIHGVDLDGDEVFWKTPAERVADRAEWLASYDRRQREEFAEQKERLDRDYEALPDALKARIDRFRAESEGFRVTSEGYELFTCTEAAKFASRARAAVAHGQDVEAVAQFWERDRGDETAEGAKVWTGDRPDEPEVAWLLWAWALNSDLFDYDYERQRQVLGASEEHSGNTFGGAMMLAVGLIRGEKL